MANVRVMHTADQIEDIKTDRNNDERNKAYIAFFKTRICSSPFGLDKRIGRK